MSDIALSPSDLKRRMGRIAAATAGHAEPFPHAPLVVDLRPGRQFRRRHIPGSHNISTARLLSGEPPERDLILISERGELDAAIAHQLHDNGFHRRIEHLQGGLQAWHSAGLPLNGASVIAPTATTQLSSSLREPWLISLVLLAVAVTLQHGSPSLVITASLLWGALAALSLLLQRGSRQLLRRCP
jgi:rhodanese-related sulfurtransferase